MAMIKSYKSQANQNNQIATRFQKIAKSSTWNSLWSTIDPMKIRWRYWIMEHVPLSLKTYINPQGEKNRKILLMAEAL